MADTYWDVLDAERGIYAHEYCFDGKDGLANTLALRLRDGELCVISPSTDITDADFAELEKHGKTVALVAPNGFHYLGQAKWQQRYPDARAFTPAAWVERIAKKAPDIKRCEPISAIAEMLPEDMWIGEPPHLKRGDVAARVKANGGTFWYFTDLLMNLRKLPDNLAVKLLFKWTKSGPGLSMTRALFPLVVKDKQALKRWLLSEFEQNTPTRVLTGHGPVLVDTVADSLSAAVQRA